MTVDRRVTYRRSHSYNTRSNKIRKVKTPGGSVVVHYQTKKAKGVRCAATGVQLQGVSFSCSSVAFDCCPSCLPVSSSPLFSFVFALADPPFATH